MEAKKLRSEIKRLIMLNNVYESDDPKIEEIADRFPDAYGNEQEYVEFQRDISLLVDDLRSQQGCLTAYWSR